MHLEYQTRRTENSLHVTLHGLSCIRRLQTVTNQHNNKSYNNTHKFNIQQQKQTIQQQKQIIQQ